MRGGGTRMRDRHLVTLNVVFCTVVALFVKDLVLAVLLEREMDDGVTTLETRVGDFVDHPLNAVAFMTTVNKLGTDDLDAATQSRLFEKFLDSMGIEFFVDEGDLVVPREDANYVIDLKKAAALGYAVELSEYFLETR